MKGIVPYDYAFHVRANKWTVEDARRKYSWGAPVPTATSIHERANTAECRRAPFPTMRTIFLIPNVYSLMPKKTDGLRRLFFTRYMYF